MKWKGVNYVRHTSGCVEGDSLRNMAKVLSLYTFLFGVVYMRHLCYHMIGHVTCSSRPFHAIPDLPTNLDPSAILGAICAHQITSQNLCQSYLPAQFVPVRLWGVTCACKTIRHNSCKWEDQMQFSPAKTVGENQPRLKMMAVCTLTGRSVHQLHGMMQLGTIVHTPDTSYTSHITGAVSATCMTLIQLEPTIIQHGAICAHTLTHLKSVIFRTT